MPEFISDEELSVFLTTGDVATVVEKADAFIKTLFTDIETVKAKADAAAITAEQTCSILEQKYLSLSAEFSALESRDSKLNSSVQELTSELAGVQSEKHQLYLKFIEKDGEIERLKTEVSGLQKSKRQLVDLIGVKDTEISEKSSTIKCYLEKIADMTNRAAQREARISEFEAELLRCKSHCEKTLQEKELFEKHNAWLNSELTTKVDSFLDQRRKNAEFEAEMSAKLADVERQCIECSSSLTWHKERVRELELKMESLQQELCSARDDASAAEQRYSVEIATVSKLVDLYKESSEEWSRKAGELEGVIKALETHLNQAESDYREKIDSEVSATKEAEMETRKLTEKVSKLEAELESGRRASELDILPVSSFEALPITARAHDHAVVPNVPAGVSGTALATSLLREGWSLAKMYAKYQEAADALRHEQMGRKHTEAILERVLFEIEEKASILLAERAEHERMADTYALMNQKLHQSVSERDNLERVQRELKSEVKKCEREYNYSQKEISDLQKQVTILLKECRDVQLRCGSVNQDYMDDDVASSLTEVVDESDAQKVISENLISVKHIKGLVEQNAKLRSLVRNLSDEVENRETLVKEQFMEELKRHKDEAASRVAAVLERAEEQGRMIESLHSSVSMYRRLYEEEHRLRSSILQTAVAPSEDGRKDLMLLLESSQEAAKRVQEQASVRVRCLEEELASQKTELISMRSERDKVVLEAKFAQEKLERFVKEVNHRREESNGILVRNIEFSQIIVDYQKKLRESSESVHSVEELSRKLHAELSVLRREKELLLNSEKRAQDEVRDLSQRVYRLQASLDTVQSMEQVRGQARAEERRKQEEHINQIEREWAAAKNELQEERNIVRTLSLDRENTVKDAMRQVEEMRTRLEAALQAVKAADSRATAAEARYSDLEKNLKLANSKIDWQDSALNVPASTSEVIGDLTTANQEIERLKSEALASKEHMLQYKSIAQVNEAALKQMEAAHGSFKIEAEQLKKSLESEIESLKDRIHELENESSLKSKEIAFAASQKDEALASALAEITVLKVETSNKVSQFMAMEVQVSVLKEELERAHQRAHTVQANYERQVILQAETIQELTKTSQALGLVQEEISELRRTVGAYKSENVELKAKWVSEKSELEKSTNVTEKKYDELNDQNKVLHSQLEAFHVKLAEKERGADATPATTSDESQTEASLHSVVSYLRRSREIAETEISLLKQEKLRLQSQLERALKAAEAAEASLSAERVSSRSVFTEGEFKALKLQVSEINLLRESNMQLREENRHNFDECQKLREVAQRVKVESEQLQNGIKEREVEVEGLRKEVEVYKKDKQLLEGRISEMLKASKNVNVEDYNRLKIEVEELQASVKAKEAIIEDSGKLISQKQELIVKLEQDLASVRLELTERDSRHLAQIEGLKLDVEKHKKSGSLWKRKHDSLLREKEQFSEQKESLLNEKETLLGEKEVLGKEKNALLKEKEVLLKEKDDLSKEKQAISKQLEDLLQEKKATADSSVDPATRNKEKEKDTRIQLLELTVGKEKEKRQSIEKSLLAKVEIIAVERKKIEEELERQREAVGKISDELEKFKHAKDTIPEDTSMVHLPSGKKLDDRASTYVSAVENFEREAHLVLNEVGNKGSASDSSPMDATPVEASVIQASTVEMPVTTRAAAPISPPEKVIEEREKKVSLPKTRKLVRPRLLKPGELRRNVEKSGLGGSKNAGIPSSVQEMAIPSSESLSRKRPASPSPSVLQEEHLQPGDSGTDFPEPSQKKSKTLDSVQVEIHSEIAAPENVEAIPTVEELLDAVDDVPKSLADEASDWEKDDETFEELENEATEIGHSNDTKTLDIVKDNIANEESSGKASELDQMIDKPSDLQAVEDAKQPMIGIDDQEEGEMPSESSDLNVGNDTSTTALIPPSSRVNEDALPMDVKEETSPEQMEEGELDEDAADDSNKSNDGDEQATTETDQVREADSGTAEGTVTAMESSKSNDGDEQTAGETDQVREADSNTAEGTVTATESVGSKDNSSGVRSGQEPEQPSQTSTTINLSDRARLRAAARLRLSSPASTSPTTTSPGLATRRGRGRPVGALGRSRGRRGAHQG